ncbi:MAG TPA: hypothetical protein PLM29_06215, partial [Deltaproteobacteria bacterium]|nr:hypothetical protein [Deltaproteobacteria bacterium]
DMKGLAEVLLPDAVFVPSEHVFYQGGCQADIVLEGAVAGHMGALSRDILELLDIEDDVYCMEISVEPVFSKTWRGMEEIPRFPMTWRDLSLVVKEDVSYHDIVSTIESKGIRELRSVMPIDLYVGEKLPEGLKGITVRVTYQSDTRTLEDKTINKWQESIIQSLQKDLGVSLRQ